ncbi:bestrophin family protein [Flaviaesturariibacter amylovorans]|uniref:Bestrophin family ion channel n=1 Tax=Flaviaesturariibacter amylovorans TaxID=1084520 RepID=A0ABP8HNW8_9BACT
MYVGKVFTPRLLWHFARRNLLRSLLISVLACVLHQYAGWRWLGISFIPIATIGTAVAFYVGFKNNQAYDRLWEARRLWGGITNNSRTFAALFISLVPDKALQREFLYRHIAWVNVLRLQLRKTIPWATGREHLHQTFLGEKHELEQFEAGLKKIFGDAGTDEYFVMLRQRTNIANHLLKKQIHELGRLKRAGRLDAIEHSDLVKQIGEFINHQGGCERIKSTPLYRQYSIFSRVFVVLFICLLPFGLINEMSKIGAHGVWLTVPFSMLISWVFYTMEQIGEFSENPFDNSMNDVPLSAICTTIETDMREFVGDTEMPAKAAPLEDVLL